MECVKNVAGSRRCPRRNSGKLPAKVGVRPMKKARRTSGRLMKLDRLAEKVGRSVAADAGAWYPLQPQM